MISPPKAEENRGLPAQAHGLSPRRFAPGKRAQGRSFPLELPTVGCKSLTAGHRAPVRLGNPFRQSFQPALPSRTSERKARRGGSGVATAPRSNDAIRRAGRNPWEPVRFPQGFCRHRLTVSQRIRLRLCSATLRKPARVAGGRIVGMGSGQARFSPEIHGLEPA
jgi:hypothetical protein